MLSCGVARMFLKIVSGSRAGVEISLAHGSYILGTQDHCDFLIGDRETCAVSAVLTVSEAGVALTTAGEDEVGRLLPARTVAIVLGEIFRIGDTELLVTPAVAENDARDEGVEEAQEALPTPDATLAAAADPDHPEAEAAAQHDEQPIPRKKAGLLRMLAAAVSGSLLLAAAAVAFVPDAARAPARQQAKGAAQQALLQGVGHLVTPVDRYGKTHLLAYFSSEAQRREIEDAIAALGLDAAYRLELHAEVTLLAELRQYLAAQGLDLTPRLNGPGRVLLSGLLPPERAPATIADGLASAFDAVAQVDYSISPDAEVERLVRHLAKEQAVDLVSLASAPHGGSAAVVAGATCVNILRNKLQSHADAGRALFRLGLMSDVAAGRDAETIRKITVKPYRFAVLADGQVVFEGGKIGDTPVKRIRSDAVEMSSGAVLKTPEMRSPGSRCGN